jgi:Flp pilus assembly pilin Flp
MTAELELVKLYGTLLLLRCGRVGRRLLAVEVQVGQSTVEYALIGALIVVVASAAVMTLGGTVKTIFENLNTALKARAPGT